MTTMTTTTSTSRLWSLCVLLHLVVYFAVSNRAVSAIDPEYEPDRRLNQIITAIVRTMVAEKFGVRSRSDVQMADLVTFRCRKSIDSGFAIVTIPEPHTVDRRISHRRRLSSLIDVGAPLAILIHGWFDSFDRMWFNRTADAYQQHVGGNFCTVDWNPLAEATYERAAQNTKLVAKQLAEFVRRLDRRGLTMERVTLIGHSFGAQVAGLAGSELNGRVGRIFGLDPAGWLFTKPDIVGDAKRLDRTDAVYVQCMHTNGNVIGLGSGVACGHQDFYPNAGVAPQPGCLRPREGSGLTTLPLSCSHFKAVQYFIASLDPANRFRAWRCPRGYDSWQRGQCASNPYDYMGVHSKNQVAGKLYLRTMIHPPFAASD